MSATHPKVLIIDDCETDRFIMSHHLKSTTAVVVMNENLTEAQQSLQEQQFSHIFCDLNLPDGDGLAFAQSILTSIKAAGTQVIVMSSSVSEALESKAKKIGVEIVQKEFDASHIMKNIPKA